MTAEEFVPSHADLAAPAKAAAHCEGCELYRDATRTVFGHGDEHARLVLIGEQPGDQEDKRGLPFVGPAGALLADLRTCAELAGHKRKQQSG